MHTVASNRCFGGVQSVLEHRSRELNCDMRVAVFVPDTVQASAPTLVWLSGLTCNEQNFITKAGAQRIAGELGLILIAPDTSPRGDQVPDDPEGAYDFGLGAGFYVDATEAPWATHYRMRSYLERELLTELTEQVPIDPARVGITGHSMGGHGALTLALRNPTLFRSVSAFAPICAPSRCPWGEKALTGYLGSSRDTWRPYDACALIEDGARVNDILIDQGGDDEFLAEQLRPDDLQAACSANNIPLTVRTQAGFDHSYYFIASFIEDHLRWHHERLA